MQPSTLTRLTPGEAASLKLLLRLVGARNTVKHLLKKHGSLNYYHPFTNHDVLKVVLKLQHDDVLWTYDHDKRIERALDSTCGYFIVHILNGSDEY